MRARLALALGLAAAVTLPAQAADPFGVPIASETLSEQRGGHELLFTDNVLQGNTTEQSGATIGRIQVGGTKASGVINPATVTANHGITTVLQNTGDLVNVNNNTNVNVYLR